MALSCWILTDGRMGTENNARGLAEALGLPYEVKNVLLRQPWKSLSPWLRCGLRHAFTTPLQGPWPDVVITAGRTPAVGSLYIGQQSPLTKRIHITSPGIAPKHFDLVIAPQHDGLKGANVVQTKGALHRVTPAKLEEAARLWAPRFAHLPRPYYAVLVGGAAHGYTLGAATAERFMRQIAALGGSTLVTASRRTGPEARTALAAHSTYLWDGTGDNPYLGLLALADGLFVTADSVSMLSEAASVGKPTYLLPLDGHAEKLERCHAALLEGGYLRRFTGSYEPTPTRTLDDMGKAVEAAKRLIF